MTDNSQIENLKKYLGDIKGIKNSEQMEEYINSSTARPSFDDISSIDRVFSSNKFTAHKRRIQFEWTPKICWYIIPTIELNFSLKEVAINILCLGIYFNYGKK